MGNKKICWVTSTYFLDVDLPIVPHLKSEFDIDWIIITNKKNEESDKKYIESQSKFRYYTEVVDLKFYSTRLYKFYKNFIMKIESKRYDWYYFDITDYLYLYPLIKRYLPNDKITIACHNVKTPKGARLPILAKNLMRYILNNFKHFQVFSKNQYDVTLSKKQDADVFYCPLVIKDYGNRGEYKKGEVTKFLFFGNIIKYKRLDLLLDAINILIERGIKNFKVSICGNCSLKVWERVYSPKIIYPDYINLDIRRIPNENVSFLFNNHDYFVMPYQDIAQSGAMTVALNYDMPIIASRLDTFEEFIIHGKTGFFFEPGDATALADAMIWAINNSNISYEQLRHNVNHFVETTLTGSIIIEKYIEYFKSRICPI